MLQDSPRMGVWSTCSLLPALENRRAAGCWRGFGFRVGTAPVSPAKGSFLLLLLRGCQIDKVSA